MKKYLWIVFILSIVLLTNQAQAHQFRIEPSAGVYYFNELNSSSVGSGISFTLAKEVGTIKKDDSLLGVRFGVAFVNPEVDSFRTSIASSCTTTTSNCKSTTVCSLIPGRETLHLTNFNLAWLAETAYNEAIMLGWEMGLDVWSSNLSSSDLGVRFGGNVAYKVKPNILLKLGTVYSGLAEADVGFQQVDISNFYFNTGVEWRF